MKIKMRIMLLIMCLVLLGSTMTVFAIPLCCDNMHIDTRYEPAHPGTWIIEYCTSCGAIHSKTWVPYEMY